MSSEGRAVADPRHEGPYGDEARGTDAGRRDGAAALDPGRAGQDAAGDTGSREPAAAPEGGIRRGVARWLRYDLVGVGWAVAFFCLSLTPSLLPRGWILQGLIGGVSAAIGYGVGLVLRWAGHWVAGRRIIIRRRAHAGRWLAAAAGTAVIVFLLLDARWQSEIHQLMGVPAPEGHSYAALLAVAAVLAAALIGLGRLLRRAARWLTRLLSRRVAPAVARLAAVVAVAALALGLLNGVLVNGFFTLADGVFQEVNDETEPGVSATADALRSGGPGSLVSWQSLGNQGRTFVAGGPSDAQLAGFSGPVPAPRHPIRVYTGLDSAPTTAERAALAVQELRRTGAFSRELLCVITTTGTGWVEPTAAAALEYMYRGDTALVAMQYSYLPSWISFLVDKERAREAGRELFQQVYAAWEALPAANRPKLVSFGESLGSFGAESAFSGAEDMSARTNGMVLVGPPNRNTLWREFQADRDPGTTAVQPVYQQGSTVRFGDTPARLDQPATPWQPARVAYLQHPSDPIVWWSPQLILQRPDWLEEPRGHDVLPAVRWYPFVTFWQVTADMAFSTGVPNGHGHSYGTETAQAWSRVAPPPGWTPERTGALVATLQSAGGNHGGS